MRTIRNLLTSIVDYAGLFPPAKLPMRDSVRNYAAYVARDESWMLGRFVLPLARLREFWDEAAGLLPRSEHDEPWRLSALVQADSARELSSAIDDIFAFNSEREDDPGSGSAVIDTIELRAPAGGADGARFCDEAMNVVPEQIEAFFELPIAYDVRGVIAAIAGTGGRAKARLGGVTPDLIPSCEDVARFINACAAAEVPFKMTAGLHHPVRAEQALTYDDNAPRAVMHGFLNVFLASAFVRRDQLTMPQAQELLDERDPGAFAFTDDEVRWRDFSLGAAELASARESFAISFGSCSFEEPIADLCTLGLFPENAS